MSDTEVFHAISYIDDIEAGFIDWGLFATLEEAISCLRDYLLADVFEDAFYPRGWSAPWGQADDWPAAHAWIAAQPVEQSVAVLAASLGIGVAVNRRVVRNQTAAPWLPGHPPSFPKEDGRQQYRSTYGCLDSLKIFPPAEVRSSPSPENW